MTLTNIYKIIYEIPAPNEHQETPFARRSKICLLTVYDNGCFLHFYGACRAVLTEGLPAYGAKTFASAPRKCLLLNETYERDVFAYP